MLWLMTIVFSSVEMFFRPKSFSVCLKKETSVLQGYIRLLFRDGPAPFTSTKLYVHNSSFILSAEGLKNFSKKFIFF